MDSGIPGDYIFCIHDWWGSTNPLRSPPVYAPLNQELVVYHPSFHWLYRIAQSNHLLAVLKNGWVNKQLPEEWFFLTLDSPTFQTAQRQPPIPHEVCGTWMTRELSYNGFFVAESLLNGCKIIEFDGKSAMNTGCSLKPRKTLFCHPRWFSILRHIVTKVPSYKDWSRMQCYGNSAEEWSIVNIR